MIHVALTDERLDPAAVTSLVSSDTYGAGVVFIGTVRSTVSENQVLYLEYEAYRPMAEKEMTAIAEAAEDRWHAAVAITHRLGRCNVGEASVVVAAGSAHRGAAFDACRWVMDEIKSRVPIWKKEVCAGDAHWVEGPNHSAIPASASLS